MTDHTPTTPIRPIIVYGDCFTYNYKYMREGVMYNFVYLDTRMAIKKEGKNMRIYSE